MDLGFSGRVAMVAAASKGIGLAVATALAREGCRVSICSRDPEALEEAKRRILEDAPGAATLPFTCDVTRKEELEAWHHAAAEELGSVEILTEEQWRRGIDLTLMNVVRLCRLVPPEMRRRRWGRVLRFTLGG